MGNGDDPCANHPNRVYATIRNIGDATASNALVHFQVSSPLGVGVTGSWTEIGSVKIPSLAAGATRTVFVDWAPSVKLTQAEIKAGAFKFHSCIQVIIDRSPARSSPATIGRRRISTISMPSSRRATITR